MKRFYFPLAIFLILSGTAPKISSLQAQVLLFCEDVDENGYPKNESSAFSIAWEGGRLKVLVKLDDEIDCKKVKYVIYKVPGNGIEKYDTTITQTVQENWIWFWKEITFYDEGKYNIYAFNQYDNFLASGTVKINFRN